VRQWLITDTHFGHKNITEYTNRPDGWEDMIIDNLSVVEEGDIIYHLGDFALREHAKWAKRYHDALPNDVCSVLIKGNHDRKSKHWYLNHGFTVVDDWAVALGYVEDESHAFILSHKPIDISKRVGVSANFHGHFHNAPIDRWEPGLRKLALRPDHYLLVLEDVGYRPVPLRYVIGEWWKPIKSIDAVERHWRE